MKNEYLKKETASFKELVKNEQIFAPCVWDCRTARAAELSGFKALMLSGGQLAESIAGLHRQASRRDARRFLYDQSV